jgi:molybdopterin converting factor small subunit
VALAARQAVVDCQDRIEKAVAGYRSAAYEETEARIAELREQADKQSSAWEAELRSTLEDLDERRARLSDRMQEQAESGTDRDLAQTRHELYELIHELTRLCEPIAEEDAVVSDVGKRS